MWAVYDAVIQKQKQLWLFLLFFLFLVVSFKFLNNFLLFILFLSISSVYKKTRDFQTIHSSSGIIGSLGARAVRVVLADLQATLLLTSNLTELQAVRGAAMKYGGVWCSGNFEASKEKHLCSNVSFFNPFPFSHWLFRSVSSVYSKTRKTMNFQTLHSLLGMIGSPGSRAVGMTLSGPSSSSFGLLMLWHQPKGRILSLTNFAIRSRHLILDPGLWNSEQSNDTFKSWSLISRHWFSEWICNDSTAWLSSLNSPSIQTPFSMLWTNSSIQSVSNAKYLHPDNAEINWLLSIIHANEKNVESNNRRGIPFHDCWKRKEFCTARVQISLESGNEKPPKTKLKNFSKELKAHSLYCKMLGQKNRFECFRARVRVWRRNSDRVGTFSFLKNENVKEYFAPGHAERYVESWFSIPRGT